MLSLGVQGEGGQQQLCSTQSSFSMSSFDLDYVFSFAYINNWFWPKKI